MERKASMRREIEESGDVLEKQPMEERGEKEMNVWARRRRTGWTKRLRDSDTMENIIKVTKKQSS